MSDSDVLLTSIIESAQRMGVELDRDEALRWMEAMATEDASDIAVDVDSGVYGHRVSMADHDDADLARIRRVAVIAGLPDRPPTVTTALALSGSAAQGKIQRFPADCDFFERVHIVAPTREAALDILGDVLRDHALATLSRSSATACGKPSGAPTMRRAPSGARRSSRASGISWTPAEVAAGVQELIRAGWVGARASTWADAPGRPGWAKLDWLVGDRTRGILANASNVIDPTWEAPDGTIVPLDGFLEPYFQEVYLEAESIPLFTAWSAGIGADAVDDYVAPAGARGLEVHGRDAQPRQGGAPDVQRLPARWALRGGRLPAGAVRRAGDGAVPAGGAAPDGRRRGVPGTCSTGSCSWARWTSSSCPPSRPSRARTRR